MRSWTTCRAPGLDMPVRLSEYYIRIKVPPSDVEPYHAALFLADKVSKDNPGLTVEVYEDKVWASMVTQPTED